MSVSFFRDLSHTRKVSRQGEPSKRQCRPVSDSIRYITFVPSQVKHELIRPGIPIPCAPNEMRDQLTERHLFHFRAREAFRDRTNPDTPVYIGVFLVGAGDDQQQQYVYPLDGDLKHIYQERQDLSKMWSLVDNENETPYWVDVYAVRMRRKHNNLNTAAACLN